MHLKSFNSTTENIFPGVIYWNLKRKSRENLQQMAIFNTNSFFPCPSITEKKGISENNWQYIKMEFLM